jgi:2-haloacid dehalogenase
MTISQFTRRDLLTQTASGVGAAAVSAMLPRMANAAGRYKAILFDGFPIFDPRSINALAKDVVGEKSDEFIGLWRRKQFEYSWLRMTGDQYKDFWRVSEDALRFSANELKLTVAPEAQARLMNGFLEMNAWPDVKSALQTLHEAGIKLGFLSNLTDQMLHSSIKHAKLDGLFDLVLSTDRAKTYKPSRRAYQMGLDALKLKRNEVLFAPFAGWDAAGAKWFGYPTFWVNRLGSAEEELDTKVDARGRNLDDLVAFVKG